MYIFYTLSCSFRLIEQTGVDFCAVQIIIISRAACRTQVFFCQYRAKFSNRALLGTAVQPSCTVKALPGCYAAQAGAQAFIQQKAPFPFHGKGAFETVLLVVDFCHVSDEHQNLVAVAPLIVIPGNELDELVGQSDTGLRVKDGGMRVGQKVRETTASSV